MSKSLIVYFSRTGNNYVGGSIKNLTIGNTEVAAKMIQELTGADLYKIEPVIAYDNDYNVCIEEAQKDKQANARPKFKNEPNNIEAYDTIYLGYPNYWGTMPMHVWTFLENYDFSGKTIKPFCTHEGSGMGSSERDIQTICPNAKLEKGLAIKGGSASGNRDYTEAECRWIHFIKCMRNAGLSIEVLVEYVALFQQGAKTATVRKELLIEQRKKIVEKIEDLQSTLDYLDQKIDGYDDHMLKYEENLEKFPE